jgi:hypothetical protein
MYTINIILIKRIILFIIISIIIYYLLVQLSYRKTTNVYRYLDINNDVLTSSHFERQVTNKLPIIIWNNNIDIDINETLHKLIPSFSIKKETINHFYNTNMVSYHNTDRVFLIARESVTIELYIPNSRHHFKYAGKHTHKYIYNYKKNNTINNIVVKLEPNDILYIPRYWLFNVSEKSVNLFVCSSLLSIVSIFQI